MKAPLLPAGLGLTTFDLLANVSCMESRLAGGSPTRKWSHLGAVLGMALWVTVPLSGQVPSAANQSALAGSWVFGAKGCANCHAINGIGKSVGPDLGRAQLQTYYDLAAAFWNHFPGMATQMRGRGIQPPRISPEDMGALIAFLTSVNSFAAPGDATRGQATFTQKQCIRCHQVGGVGGVIGPGLDYLGQAGPIEVASAMWNHGPGMAEAMRAQGIERPSLTAGELANLLAYFHVAAPRADRPFYVLPGRADLGRKWVEEKGCAGCHSFRGEGGGLAPDLARRERPLSLLEFSALLWNKAPAMQRMMRARGTPLPQLDPSEMADIVAYLYSVQYFQPQGNAAAAPALFQNKGCFGCHSSRGGRGSRGPDLAQVRSLGSLAAAIAAMWNHGRLVPAPAAAWPKLTAANMADITAFFVQAGAPR